MLYLAIFTVIGAAAAFFYKKSTEESGEGEYKKMTCPIKSSPFIKTFAEDSLTKDGFEKLA